MIAVPQTLQLWRDRRGRVSWLRIAVLAFLLWPAALTVADLLGPGLGSRPLDATIHRTGYWALIFLLVSLLVTPLRRVARFAPVVDLRRMIGVGAFLYAATHVGLYVGDQGFDLIRVATEIVKRVYLVIGLVALVGLVALAATSTDGMVRRLGGRRWRALHRASYPIAILALVHYLQQTKADASGPTIAAGFFVWMMGFRLLARRGDPSTLALLALTIAVSALTFLVEAIGIGLAFGVSPMRVLETAFDFGLSIRPGWYVLGAGVVAVAIDAVRGRQPRAPRAARAGGDAGRPVGAAASD